MSIDGVLKSNPTQESGTEKEVKKSFVGYRQNDKYWRECEEDHYQPMKVMIIG